MAAIEWHRDISEKIDAIDYHANNAIISFTLCRFVTGEN